MKKIVLSIISLLVVLLICVGCANTPSDKNHPANDNQSTEKEESSTSAIPSDSSYINGVDLSEYAIVYSNEDLDYSKRAAEYIKSEILSRTELDLPLIDDSTTSSAQYEIVVGETSRDISTRLDAKTKGTQFQYLQKKNK